MEKYFIRGKSKHKGPVKSPGEYGWNTVGKGKGRAERKEQSKGQILYGPLGYEKDLRFYLIQALLLTNSETKAQT